MCLYDVCCWKTVRNLLTIYCVDKGAIPVAQRPDCTKTGKYVGSTWAAEEGQDFIADHKSNYIDFATIHCWPDNWKVRGMT